MNTLQSASKLSGGHVLHQQTFIGRIPSFEHIIYFSTCYLGLIHIFLTGYHYKLCVQLFIIVFYSKRRYNDFIHEYHQYYYFRNCTGSY